MELSEENVALMKKKKRHSQAVRMGGFRRCLRLGRHFLERMGWICDWNETCRKEASGPVVKALFPMQGCRLHPWVGN